MKREDIAKKYTGYTLHPYTFENINGDRVPCYIVTDPKYKRIEAIVRKIDGFEILTSYDYMGDCRLYNNIEHMYETACFMSVDVGRDW